MIIEKRLSYKHLFRHYGVRNTIGFHLASIATLAGFLGFFLQDSLLIDSHHLIPIYAVVFSLVATPNDLWHRLTNIALTLILALLFLRLIIWVSGDALQVLVVWTLGVFVLYFCSTFNKHLPNVAKICVVICSPALVGFSTWFNSSDIALYLSPAWGAFFTALAAVLLSPFLKWVSSKRRKKALWFDSLQRELMGFHSNLSHLVSGSFVKMTYAFSDEISASTFQGKAMRRAVSLMKQLGRLVRYCSSDIFSPLEVEIKSYFRDSAKAVKTNTPQLMRDSFENLYESICFNQYSHYRVSDRLVFSLYIFLLGRLVGLLESELCVHDKKINSDKASFLKFISLLTNRTFSFASLWGRFIRMANSDAVKIGARSSATMTFAYLLVLFFHIPHGAWLIFTASVVLVLRQGETVRRSWQRLLGHVVGFLIAIPLCVIWSHYPSVLFGLPLILFVCIYFAPLNYFVFAVFLMIFLLGYMNMTASVMPPLSSSIHFMLLRLMDTTIGSVLAFLTALFVFPRASNYPITSTLQKARKSLAEYVICLSHSIRKKNLIEQEFLTSIADMDVYIKDYEMLPLKLRSHTQTQRKQVACLKRLYLLSTVLFEVKEQLQDIPCGLPFAPNINASFQALSASLENQTVDLYFSDHHMRHGVVNEAFAMRDSGSLHPHTLISLVGWLETEKKVGIVLHQWCDLSTR